jgi:hypothetical protein
MAAFEVEKNKNKKTSQCASIFYFVMFDFKA